MNEEEVRVYRHEWRTIYEFLNFLKHEKAYEFARQYCEGKDVLDFGCGSGYGTAILANVAKSVVGVDTSPIAVQYCLDHWNIGNMIFEKIERDYTLRFDDNTFDVIVSFQVIEHIPDVPRYLSLLKRVLKPGGPLVITTTNRAWRLRPTEKPWNRSHCREYTAKGIQKELRNFFPSVQILGVYGNPEYNNLIRATLPRPTFRAKIYWDLLHLIKRVLPKPAVRQLKSVRKAVKEFRNSGIPAQIRNNFGTDDIYIDSNLEDALDFFAIARKPLRAGAERK